MTVRCELCGTEVDEVADWDEREGGVFCHGCGEVTFMTVSSDDSGGDVGEELAVCTECDWEGYISGETCPACGGFLVEE